MSEFAQQTVAKARGLAPWRANLPWWIILVEGIAIGVMGLLLVLNPASSSINVTIGFTAVLVILGVVQLWAVFRNKIPERHDALIAVRGGIATYAGVAILLMLIYNILTLDAGRVLFGLAAIIFGIVGLLVYFGGGGKYLRGILIDSTFFLLAGLLVLYAQWAGGESIKNGTLWLGWLSLVIGLGLIGFAFWRRQQGSNDDHQPSPSLDRASARSAVARSDAGPGADNTPTTPE